MNLSAATEQVRDTFRVFPTLSDDTVRLVGFDHDGKACIALELEASEDLEAWGVWVIRWLRRREDRKRGRTAIRLLG